MLTTKRVSFVLLVALLSAFLVAGFEFPLQSQCDASLQTLTSKNGLNMCNNGSFITSLAMGLTGTAAITYMNDQPSPQYSAFEIAEHVLDSQLLNSKFGDSLFSNLVVPQMVESLSDHVHYNNLLKKDDLMSVCDAINNENAFFLADTNFSHNDTPNTVVLIAACEYTPEENKYELTIHHPKFGVLFVHPSEVGAIHHFLVAYNEIELEHNIKRVTSGCGSISPYPEYEKLSDALGVVPFPYKTFFAQCDSRWGGQVMTTKTVCAVGCLMNSVCVGIRGHGIKVGGSNCDPGVFNKWLRSNGGYTQNLFIHGVVNKVCGSQKNCSSRYPADGAQGRISLSAVHNNLKKKRVMIANVKNGGHWVLAYGWDNTTKSRILTRDSGGGARAWHNHSEIVAWRIYDMKGPSTKATLDQEDGIQFTESEIDEIMREIGLD